MLIKELDGVYLYIKHAKRNPNVNGIYYDEESYKEAMRTFTRQLKPVLKFGYDNKQADIDAPVVGYVSRVDLENQTATIVYEHDTDLMYENYCKLGFTLIGELIENCDKPTYLIEKIICANIIIWQL